MKTTSGSGADHGSTEFRDDYRQRQIVRYFESSHGRTPNKEELPSNNPGYDIESRDRMGRLRRIEIKGVTADWVDGATVNVSLTQFNHGRNDVESDVEYWLYVVDRKDSDQPRVFAFRNAMRKADRFVFQACDWASRADEFEELDFPVRLTEEGA